MNTLNALTEWVESDPKTGVKMIEALAGEFRLLSQICDRSLIPLAEEIALCRRHLEVMSYRVDRAFTLDSEGVNENLDVPPGVLHTLVENAFTHGRFVDGGVFRLRQSGDKEITLTLIAPPAEARTPQTTGGEGMSYVRGRLEAAFGASARADTGPTPEGWRTILTLPRPLPS
jgi:LytS/YehU family sensor histidine kinase